MRGWQENWKRWKERKMRGQWDSGVEVTVGYIYRRNDKLGERKKKGHGQMIERAWRRMRRWREWEREQEKEGEEEEENEVGCSKVDMALVFPLAVTRWDEGRRFYSSTEQTSDTHGLRGLLNITWTSLHTHAHTDKYLQMNMWAYVCGALSTHTHIKVGG